MAQIHHIAEHARDKEERRFRPALAFVHGDQMGKSALVGFATGVAGRVGSRANAVFDHGGTGGDGRRLEQNRDREINAIGFFTMANRRTAISEWPPRAKKSSITPTWPTPSRSCQKPTRCVQYHCAARHSRCRDRGGRRSGPRVGWPRPFAPCAIKAGRSSDETMTCGRPLATARRKASAPSSGRMPWVRLCSRRSSAGERGRCASASSNVKAARVRGGKVQATLQFVDRKACEFRQGHCPKDRPR